MTPAGQRTGAEQSAQQRDRTISNAEQELYGGHSRPACACFAFGPRTRAARVATTAVLTPVCEHLPLSAAFVSVWSSSVHRQRPAPGLAL